MTGTAPRPGDRWPELLRATAVPRAVVDRSPEPEPAFPPGQFRWSPGDDAEQPVRPSRRRALEALREGGTVLDVGVGGGASSLGLAPKASLVIGVDPLEAMLESFQASAREAGVAARPVLGTWPDVADGVPAADAVVFHHTLNYVEEIEEFVTALTDHARHRVVVELLAPFAPRRLRSAVERLPRHRASGVGRRRRGPRRAPRHGPRRGTGGPRAAASVPRRDARLGGVHPPPPLRRSRAGRQIEEYLRAREPQEHRVVALWWPGGA